MPYLRFGGGWASTPSLPLKPSHDADRPAPPPYEHAAAARSGFVAQTTTTTTITQTTTTFIPLTLWHHDRAVDLDKDLPATPSSAKAEPGSSRSSSPFAADRPLAALAQASLGLGLHAPPPSPSHQSGHLTVDAQRPRPRVASNPVLRKSRSFSHEPAQREPAPQPEPVPPVPPRPPVPPSPERAPTAVASSSAFQEKRTRRLSFGASLLAPFRSQAVAAADLPPSPPPANLARKSSFWARKRATTLQVDTQQPQPPPQPSESEKTPSLPSMQPFTPLTIDNPRSPAKPQPLQPIQQYSISSTSFIIPDSPANNLPTAPGSAAVRRRSTISSAGERSPNLSLEFAVAPAPAPAPPPASRTSTASSSPRVSFLQPSLSRPASSDPLHLHESPVSTPIESQSPSTTPEPKLAPRQRAMTNPTLFRRISFFATPSTPPPPVEDIPQPQPPPPKPAPPPMPQGESPEAYVQRLTEVVTKAEVANVLAASNDEFHVRALQAYMGRFAFDGDPLDVALRKLLMHMALPRETQQIDRVMEAFATRYSTCNPSLFASSDTPYVLAFSLMMLHTDAFNKSNKRKMTKADYVKNTRLPGVQPELLEYFWDQITFAPFIFIEDPLDVNGSRLLSTSNGSALSTPSLLGRSNRVDPYYLIAQDLLGPLRVDVHGVISQTDPYSVHGGDSHVYGAWDARDLQRVFASAPLVELEDKDTVDRRKSVMIGAFPATLTTVPSVMPAIAYPGDLTLDDPWPGEILTLRVTKVGVLWRKDELAEGGRRASSRKWREWSVVLTGSQLLFFRDPSVATGLIPSSFESPKDDVRAGTTTAKAQFLVPEIEILRPDEILSVEDSVALCDATYDKYPHAFRFSMPKGRQLLLRATNEAELIAWLALINYASAFKTAGVRMRPLGLSWKEIEGAGMAAARFHLRDLQQRASGNTSPSSSSSKPARSWGAGQGKTSGEHQRDSGSSRPSLALSSYRQSSATLPLSARQSPSHSQRPRPRASWSGGTDGLDIMDALLPEFDMSEQFKMTFDEVKAELASNNAIAGHAGGVRRRRRPSTAPAPAAEEGRPLPPTIASRAELINSKIRDLDSRIATEAPVLEAELRFANQLSVLTPFRQTTRDRIVVVLGQLARRVAYLRMDLAKMRAHRDTLAADIAEERRQWVRTRNQALQIAVSALNNSKAAILPRVSLPDGSQPQSPRSPRSPGLRISAAALRHNGVGSPDPGHLSPNDPSATFVTPSTPSGSVDSHFSSLGQSDVEQEHVDSLGPLSSSLSSAGGLFASSLSGASSSSVASVADRSSSSLTSPSPHHDKFFTATESPEEAEEWDRTRAAKRVSLVRLPADTLAVIFSQHTRHISDGPGGDQSDALARSVTPRAEAHMRSSSSSH